MNCPLCDTLLIPGEAYFRKSATDFISFGLGSEDLRMRRDDGLPDIPLLYSSEKTAAQYCEECGVVVVATQKGRRSAVRKRAE